ncbi:MAG TPA: MFS transporter [Candidatus Limnocylindrales bacterium]|nr:MFS transporter [Candidatus Limnocylindrales bacterium]
MLSRFGGGLGANYWKLWASSAFSNLADGVFFIALPLLAVRLTDSPLLIAGLAIAMRLPWLLFVLIAGALADRLDRRRTMVAVQLLRAAIAGLLAASVFFGFENLVLLYAVGLILGIGETLFDTAAQSVMPALVRREQLPTANGRLYGVEIVANQFVGPPLGGLLMALAIVSAFGLSAAAWLVAALLLFAIVGSFRPVREGPPTRIRSDIVEGLRYLLGHRLLRTLAVMVGVMNLASSAAFAIFVLFAIAPGPMGLSEPEFGVLLTTGAIGSIAGSVYAGRLVSRFGRARLLVAAILASAVSTGIPALTPNPFVVGASFVVGGSAGVVWNVITVSFRQGIIPDQLLGRVNSVYRLLAWGTMPIGALLGGVLGELFGLEIVFVVGAVLIALLLLAREVLNDDVLDAAEREAEEGRLARAQTDTTKPPLAPPTAPPV